jgi:aminoglycoside phosphotransferase (APT) family kinase protein
VLIHCGARAIAGRAFNVMERVSGHSPMEDMMSGPEAAPRVTDQLARAHVDLHDLPSGDIAGSLRESGVSAEASPPPDSFDSLSVTLPSRR